MTKLTFETSKTLSDFEILFPPRNVQEKAEITRIAPSPTGMPHIGTAMQAILDRAIADQTNGIFILRIEDTDQARTIEGAQTAILDGLKWLQTVPDEGPNGIGGDYGPYVQSERLPLYKIAAEKLVTDKHAYHCFCTTDRLNEVRSQQTAEKKTPMYDGKCRTLSDEEIQQNITEGKPFVVRMKVPSNTTIVVTDEVRGDIQFESATIDDSVLLKSDGFPTYHLASVVDDHFMRVTTVVRGEEWITSTPKHYLLYESFGWEKPRFLHTVLLRDQQKRKLSKRSGDTSLDWFRRQGFLNTGFSNFLMRIMWTHPEQKDVYCYDDFVKHMRLKDLPKTGPVADMKLLEFINNAHISSLDKDQSTDQFIDYLDYLTSNNKTASSTIDPLLPSIESDVSDTLKMLDEAKKNPHYTSDILSIKKGRYSRLAEMFFDNQYFYDSLYKKVSLDTLNKNAAPDEVPIILGKFHDLYDGQPENVQPLMKQIAKENNIVDKHVFMTLRLAITGHEKTPPMPDVLSVLGYDRVKTRLADVIKSVNETR